MMQPGVSAGQQAGGQSALGLVPFGQQEYLPSRDLLQQDCITGRAELEDALRNMRALTGLPLGEILLAERLISREQLAAALAQQQAHPQRPIGELLVRMGAIPSQAMKRALIRKLGIPCVNLRRFRFEEVELHALHQEFMRKHGIVPLFRTGLRLAVAVENPLEAPLQELAFCTKLKIDAVMASSEDLLYAMTHEVGEGRDEIGELATELTCEPAVKAVPPPAELSLADNTVVRLVNMMIMDAYELGASDIHIEPMRGEKPIIVRFRRDGVMHEYSHIPAQYGDALVSRIKIMARLDISDKRHSQDGKLAFERYGPANIELRVVTIPTAQGGEDVVMRILAAREARPPHELDLAPDCQATLEQLILQPHGLLLVCGPTGSGKTTMLHSLLSQLNNPERKIWTVEDPVEITQEGLRQVQVHAKIGWTFAAVLRTFMRADPDVIMVGETRDLETARTVMEASLTGHLVMSTLHTNSATESAVRLLDLGLDPFNFADTLIAVLGQRLVRRLCVRCSQAYAAPEDELQRLAQAYCAGTQRDGRALVHEWRARHGDGRGEVWLRAACGCPQCDDSGYRGRLGVHELLVSTPAIKKLISSRATVADLTRTAMDQGMRSLRQDGIEKILQGLTTWDQVRSI